jgi:tetratricopeptide (TPR) repeat protein
MAGELTVSERILYHLNSYVKFEDKYEVPFDITQDGISQSCSISRAHAAIELKKLKASGIIEEKLAHVRRGKARRKTYFLTQAGKVKGAKVVQYVKDNDIKPMVDASKVAPELSSSKAKSAKRSSELPSVKMFLGREKELKEARELLESPMLRVLTIKGIAGIGKTTLAAKLCTETKDQRVFWYTSRPWDGVKTLEDALSKFFYDNGSRKLSSYLSSGAVELGELSFLLNEELSENGYTFVFDDVDGSESLQGFLRMFRLSSGNAKIIVTAESEPTFYSDEDIVARREVAEMDLGGLDVKSALVLLKGRGIDGPIAEELVKATNGHPLSLEMVTASTPTEARYQVSKFLENKFYSGIPEAERSLLQYASVFQRPFPVEAIPKELRPARKHSMLREVSPGRFEVHASLREFAYSSMTPEERARWQSAAADYYLRSGELRERFYHLLRANRKLEAEILLAQSGDEFLRAGNIKRLWETLSDFEPVKPKYRCPALMVKARAASLIGKLGTAWVILEEVSTSGDARMCSEALVEMGRIKSKQGDLEMASKLFEDALDKAEDLPSERAKALRGLGVVEGKLGNYSEAQELLERSARDAMAAMDTKGMLLAHMELGNIFIGRGLYAEAIEHFAKCAAGFGPVELTNVYVNMGVANAALGNLDEAEIHLTNAVKLAEETGQPRSRAYALTSLAEVAVKKGKPDEAKDMCFAALEIVTELNDRLAVSAAYATLGLAELASGNLDSSEEYFMDSLKALEGMEVPRSRGMRMLEFASVLAKKNENGKALEALRESRRMFIAIGAGDLVERADQEISRLDPTRQTKCA